MVHGEGPKRKLKNEWDQLIKGVRPGGQLDRINELCVSGFAMSCGVGAEVVSLGEGSLSQGCPHQQSERPSGAWASGSAPAQRVVAAWLQPGQLTLQPSVSSTVKWGVGDDDKLTYLLQVSMYQLDQLNQSCNESSKCLADSMFCGPASCACGHCPVAARAERAGASRASNCCFAAGRARISLRVCAAGSSRSCWSFWKELLEFPAQQGPPRGLTQKLVHTAQTVGFPGWFQQGHLGHMECVGLEVADAQLEVPDWRPGPSVGCQTWTWKTRQGVAGRDHHRQQGQPGQDPWALRRNQPPKLTSE